MKLRLNILLPIIAGVACIGLYLACIFGSMSESYISADTNGTNGTWHYDIDGLFTANEWATIYNSDIVTVSVTGAMNTGATSAQLRSSLQNGYTVTGANAWTVTIPRYVANVIPDAALRLPGSDSVYDITTDNFYDDNQYWQTHSNFGNLIIEAPEGTTIYNKTANAIPNSKFSVPVGVPTYFSATANTGYTVQFIKSSKATSGRIKEDYSIYNSNTKPSFTAYKTASGKPTMFNDTAGYLYAVWSPNVYNINLYSDSACTKRLFQGKLSSYGLTTLRYGYDWTSNGSTSSLVYTDCKTDSATIDAKGYLNSFKYTVMSDVSVKNPTRIGYTFAGWVDKATGVSTKNLSWTGHTGVVGNKNYYETWTANPVKVNYNINKPTASVANVTTSGSLTETLAYNDTVDNIPTMNIIGYNFKGFKVPANASSYYGLEPSTAGSTGSTNVANTDRYVTKTDGTFVNNGTRYRWNDGSKEVASVTAYAQWELETDHTISFDLNTPIKGNVDKTRVLAGVETNYEGTASHSIVSTGVKTLTCDWQGALPATVAVPSLEGWTFKGWYVRQGKSFIYNDYVSSLATNDSARMLYDEDGNLNTSLYKNYYFHNTKDGVDITLYARWEPEMYVLYIDTIANGTDSPHWASVLNSAGGSFTSARRDVYFDHTIRYALTHNDYLGNYKENLTKNGDLPEVTLIGFDFIEWRIKGAKVTTDTVYKWREDLTFGENSMQAYWTPHKYSILFKPYTATGGLDVVPDPTAFQHHPTGDIPKVEKTNEGILVTFLYNKHYKFPDNWYTETHTISFDSCGGTDVNPAIEIYDFLGWHLDVTQLSGYSAPIVAGQSRFIKGDGTRFGNDIQSWNCIDCKKWNGHDYNAICCYDITNKPYGDFLKNSKGKSYIFGLSPIDGAVIECIPIFESRGITLPDSQKDDSHFGGWYDYTQKPITTDQNNDGILDYALLSSGKCYGAAGQNTKTNGASKYSGYYHGIGVYGGQSSYADIRNYSSNGRTALTDDTGRHCDYTLYAWWNKKPVYVDVYDNIFREGQLITVDDLYKLVAVYDYEDDYYNTALQKIYNLPTAYLEDIYMDKTADDSEDDENNDTNEEDTGGTSNSGDYEVKGDEEVEEPEDVDNMYPGWTKVTGITVDGKTLEVYAKDGKRYYTPEAKQILQEYLLNESSLEISIKEITYFTNNGIDYSNTPSKWQTITFDSTNNHGKVSDVQHSWLSTATSRLVKNRNGLALGKNEWYGDFAIVYSVTDKGLSLIEDVIDADYGVSISEELLQCTLNYTRYGKIIYNNTPEVSTYNVIDSVESDWLSSEANLTSTILNSAFTIDREDCVTNIPWWTKADAYNNLRSTLYIETVTDILFNATYEVENASIVAKVRSQLANSTNKVKYIADLFGGRLTIDGINSSKISPYIESLMVTYDCCDQFGKYATGKIKPGFDYSKVTSKGVTLTINTANSWVSVANDTANGQSNVDRSSLIVLINPDTDYEMQTANIREEVRFISSDWVFTLGAESYWGNTNYGLDALSNILKLYDDVKAGNVVDEPTHYKGVFNRSIFSVDDKVDVNVYDYTN